MSHWFFLSCARNDCDEYLRIFHRDLNDTIRKWTISGEGEDGFLDDGNIEPGRQWRDEAIAALQNCRTFVALYSPAYFESEECGKEWQLFSSRLASHSADSPSHAGLPPLIMPVLWVPESKLRARPLPAAASTVQYEHSEFGEEYAREGLRQLMSLKRYRRAHYRNFLERFADKLIGAARDHVLRPHTRLPPASEIKSAFRARGAEGSKDAKEPVSAGPRFVQFVFVAGRRDELREVREGLDPYGMEGGYDWHPYLPEVTDEVGDIAQAVATKEKLLSGFVQLDDDIIGRIKEAEDQNKIVAIVVDTWTLCLSRYSSFMAEYDRHSFFNSVVLIPWNSRDHETEINRSTLSAKMWGIFVRHAVKPDPNCFVDSISSPDELKKALSTALNRARARISAKAAVVKRAEGGQIIRKPDLDI
ncbi:MAG TPA: TIR-like protein FxsC [Pyrinomonadaceae bacterium]|nr:TIR-like protein FxsC [Pyrinomonadaceae bacterium]